MNEPRRIWPPKADELYAAPRVDARALAELKIDVDRILAPDLVVLDTTAAKMAVAGMRAALKTLSRYVVQPPSSPG